MRDLLLNKNPTDIDITTSATPKQINNLFKEHKLAMGGTYFKVSFVDGIEVATFRKDIHQTNKKVQIIEAKTITEDLSRRDITINALAFCQFTGDIIDPYYGRDDLKKRKIKFVGSAKQRIHEDPNRILRACRFLACIDGVFDPLTKLALKEYGHLVASHVAPERIRVEIIKALKTHYTSIFFNALHEIGVLKFILPSLDCCYYFDVHGKHHRESIITHSLLTGDNISSKYPLVKLAGYLHDVGKPTSCKFNMKTKDITFIYHDIEGQTLIEDELKKLTFSNKEVKYISSLVRLHMNNFNTEKSIRRTVKKLNDHNIDIRDLYRLKLADTKSNIMKGSHPFSFVKADFERIKNAINIKSCNRFDKLVINGQDIMIETGLEAGPIIGKIKERLLDIVVDNPEYNNTIDLKIIIKQDKYINHLITKI